MYKSPLITEKCNESGLEGYNFFHTQLNRACKGALAIRRIFSLVDMITKPKFSKCRNVFKLDFFGSKICIESIKIGFKEIHHLQSRKNLRLLLIFLILRL